MRILQISSASSFGGGERYLVDLSNSLHSRGHDIFAVIRPNSPIRDHLQIPAHNIRSLPLRNAFDAPSARALAKFISQNEIEIVHAHMARDYPLAAYASRRGPEPKFIVTRHVLFALNRFHRRTLSRAAKVIAVSNAVARQLREQALVPPEKIALVHNGIDVDRFQKACKNFDRKAYLESQKLPANCMLTGSVGELRTLKRHDDFIRAAALVTRELRDVHFVVAGVDTSPDGSNLRQLVSLVNELGLTTQIHFPGWLDDAEKLLCALDVFVSASETESFGLSIVEAMASGTAVVATRTDGAQEVIENNQTGRLVPIGDVDLLAHNIIDLLKDDKERQAIAQRATQVASARFSLKRMVDEIECLYWEA